MKKYFIIVQYIAVWMTMALVPKGMLQLLWVVEIAIFTLYFLEKRKKIARICNATIDGSRFMSGLKWFFVVAFFFLILSYANIPKLWGMHDLKYNPQYIYRHFMMILELVMSVGLGYCIYEKGIITSVSNKMLFSLTTVAFIIGVFGGRLLLSGIIVTCLSLLIVRKRFYGLLVAIPLAFPTTGQSTFFVCSSALIFIVVFQKWITNILRDTPRMKIFIGTTCIVVLIALFSEELMSYIEDDANSIWRFYVWKTELNSLAKTWFTGVGFGSAYVSDQMFSLSDNVSMYSSEARGAGNGVFIIASHNTFVNMFYRMGIIGGLLFVIMHVNLIIWALYNYWHSNANSKKLIVWAVATFACYIFVILFNPGLEMVQFATNYVFALAILIATLLYTQKHLS